MIPVDAMFAAGSRRFPRIGFAPRERTGGPEPPPEPMGRLIRVIVRLVVLGIVLGMVTLVLAIGGHPLAPIALRLYLAYLIILAIPWAIFVAALCGYGLLVFGYILWSIAVDVRQAVTRR